MRRKDQCLVVSCSEILSGSSLCLKFRIRDRNKPKGLLQWARLVQWLKKKKVWSLFGLSSGTIMALLCIFISFSANTVGNAHLSLRM